MPRDEEFEVQLTGELQRAMDRLRSAKGNPGAREKAAKDLSEALARFNKYVLNREVPDDLS